MTILTQLYAKEPITEQQQTVTKGPARAPLKLPIMSVILSAICGVLFWLLGAIPEALIWQLGESQRAWQWLSAHFVHISTEHLLWNIAALLILGSIIEQTSRRLLLASMVVGIVAVNAYLSFFYGLDAYAGLSGVLNSLLIIALYCLYQYADYRAAALVTLALSIIKIMIESIVNEPLFSSLPWPPVPAAHLAGLLGGALLIIVFEIRKRTILKSSLINFY